MHTPDPILSNLVAAIDAADDRMNATLTVGGLVVSGTIIAKSRYHSQMADLFGVWMHLEQTEPQEVPEFIHMENARFVWRDGPVYGSLGLLWRGRLVDVNGWCPGTIADEKQSEDASKETGEEMLRNASGSVRQPRLFGVEE